MVAMRIQSGTEQGQLHGISDLMWFGLQPFYLVRRWRWRWMIFVNQSGDAGQGLILDEFNQINNFAYQELIIYHYQYARIDLLGVTLDFALHTLKSTPSVIEHYQEMPRGHAGEEEMGLFASAGSSPPRAPTGKSAWRPRAQGLRPRLAGPMPLLLTIKLLCILKFLQ